jgi:hypothetical protein
MLWFGLDKKIKELEENVRREMGYRQAMGDILDKKLQDICPHEKVVITQAWNSSKGLTNIYKCEVCYKSFNEQPKDSKVKTIVYK